MPRSARRRRALERGGGAEGRKHSHRRPARRAWHHDGGSVGLATSGSGDTLAGIVAGLPACGAPLEQFGPLGYLASELPAEVPSLMVRLAKSDGPAS